MDIIRNQNKGKSKKALDQSIGINVACALTVDGREITDDVLSVRLEQPCDSHHSLRVTVRHSGVVERDQEFENVGTYSALMGKSITLRLTPRGDVVDSSRKLEFIGVVTAVELQQAVSEINVIHIVAYSPTIALDASVRTRVWGSGEDAASVFNAILSEYSITLGRISGGAILSASGSLNTEVDSHVQYYETDYQFIQRLASEKGYFAYYDGRAFTIDKAESSQMNETLKWRETLGSFTLGLQTGALSFRSQVWDPVNKDLVEGDADRSALRVATSQLSRASLDASELIFPTVGVAPAARHASQAAVDQTLTRRVETSVGGMLVCHGSSNVPAVSCGSRIRLEGLGDLDGDYWIKSVDHFVDEGGQYHNSFTCTPTELALPPQRQERHPFRYIQCGVVTDNNDPENLGRVKVRLSWHRADQETEFLRCMTFDGGRTRGWFALPEVDDEVVVAYERGNPDAPIVLGSLYNKRDTPPLSSSECLAGGAVSKKVFRTRLGNQIVFVDEDGKETIAITQKDGTNAVLLSMDGPCIAIESSGDITLKGANITLESASGDIVLKSGGALKGTAQSDIELKASANFKSEGGMNHESKGGVSAKMSGTQAAVEGSAMTEIKGAIVKIN